MKCALLSGLLVASIAVPAAAQTTVVPLWPGAAPGSESWTQKEATYGERGNGHVRNVVTPSLTLYLPTTATATGAAVIIAPGGGFRWLAWEKEGTLVAEWLQKRGVAALVLKYRLNDTGTEEQFQQSGGRGGSTALPAAQIQAIALADGRQAMKVARQHAAEWHVDPAKIGVMGFSAGGYIAVTMALDHDAATRPDFSGAIYTCCMSSPVPAGRRRSPLHCERGQRSDFVHRRSGALLGLDRREEACGDSHLLGRRPRLRHEHAQSAQRHVDRSIRRLAPNPETHQVTPAS